MAAKYTLYFDSVRHDNEKRIKRAIVCLIVLAHVVFFWTWEREHPHAIASLTNSAILVDFRNGLASRLPAINKPLAIAPRKGADAVHVSTSTTPETFASVSDSDDIADAAVAAGGSLSHAGAGAKPGPIFRPPTVLARPKTLYPREAFERREQGSADVLVSVGADGALVDASIRKSTGSLSLDEATLASVRAYTFRNATRGGDPVAAEAVVQVDWVITASTKIEPARNVVDKSPTKLITGYDSLTTPCNALQTNVKKDSHPMMDQCGPKQ